MSRFPSFLILCIIFHCTLDILGIILWDSGSYLTTYFVQAMFLLECTSRYAQLLAGPCLPTKKWAKVGTAGCGWKLGFTLSPYITRWEGVEFQLSLLLTTSSASLTPGGVGGLATHGPHWHKGREPMGKWIVYCPASAHVILPPGC